jgi:hypothetical protein
MEIYNYNKNSWLRDEKEFIKQANKSSEYSFSLPRQKTPKKKIKV